MTITGQSALNRDEIDRMVRDAESHAEEDRRRKEEAEVRNQADSLVYQTEKLLREQGDKITGDEKTNVEGKLKDLKATLNGTDVEAIKTGIEGLMTASQTFAQRLYEQAASESAAAGGGAGAGTGSEAPADDDVVDAEIVDDEEDKTA